MKKPNIYLITDLRNGMRYVGKHNGKRNSYFSGGKIVNAIIKKHGKENRDKILKKEIIVQGNFNDVLLNELERHYIRLLNTEEPYGYNILPGGIIEPKSEYTFKAQLTSPIKKGHVPWNKGFKGIPCGGWPVGTLRPKSLGEKESATKKAKYASGELVIWNKGRKCTEEERKTLQLSNPNNKPIGQYSNDMKLLREFISINEASRMTGIDSRNIRKCAKGKVKYRAGGFYWKFLDN